jgi:ferritin-like metal-binding protein YciE
MKKLNSFRDLFLHLLSDLYVVENLSVVELPKLAKKADSPELKTALSNHLAETKAQIKRIEEIFHILEEKPVVSGLSQNLKGLFASTETFLKNEPSSPLLDAALIVMCQRIKHFEIANYGTLAEFADCVKNDHIKKMLGETLKEEVKADGALTKIAKGSWFRTGINEEAAHHLQTAGSEK